MMSKIILGIESSCDETAAAVLLQNTNGQIKILSHIIASSADLQSKYGGIIPEQAAREQLKSIIPVIEETINESRITINDINTLAITQGPGLIGSLLVGVETAKILSKVWQKPLIPVNHLIGHFYANWIDVSVSNMVNRISEEKNYRRLTINDKPTFPSLGLLVSGGHSDLVLFKDHGKFEYLGGTRDDAAGECFDKCARLLGLPYPGGPQISKLAQNGDPKKYNLPRPLSDSNDLDFSFSGLKTAVSNLVNELSDSSDLSDSLILSNLCASIEQAIIDSLIKKTLKAAKLYKVKTIILGGGVAANEKLRSELELHAKRYSLDTKIFVPQKSLCTDNAAMIAAAAFFLKPIANPLTLQANPNLSLAY